VAAAAAQQALHIQFRGFRSPGCSRSRCGPAKSSGEVHNARGCMPLAWPSQQGSGSRCGLTSSMLSNFILGANERSERLHPPCISEFK
jgi:hypothetical protein